MPTPRLTAALAVAGLALVLTARPVAADPAGPTDYRSRVTAVTPAVDGVTVEIVGGDAFLRVVVARGHQVVVEGYRGEPYLRVGADGAVEENRNSPATLLNEDRYGQIDASHLDPTAEAEWQRIDDDGEVAWHDHRIHWMSPDRGEGVEPGDPTPTSPWQVPLVVDGRAVVVTGTLTYVGSTPALPWLGLGLVLAGAALVIGWPTRRSLLLALVAAVVGAVAATIAGWAEWSSQPEGVGASVAVAAVPIVGLVAALGSVAGAAARKPALVAVGALASAAALVGWAVLRLDVLSHPVLPTDLAAGLDRASTVAALGLGAAAAVLAVRSGALALPEAPFADEPDDVTSDG
jgi:hypothetical protein